MSYVKRISEIRANDFSLVGGKGANLGELSGLGIRIPQGFCITTEAYRDFIGGGLQNEIIEVAEALDCKRMDQVHAASNVIRGWILEKKVDEKILTEILTTYAQFNKVPVAVRSSATAEDLPNASFAGQHDSFLNVIGEDDLVDAILRGWASLWTPRAIAYRGRHDFDLQKLAMGLVVQPMIQSDTSGVLFTVDISEGESSRMLINATYGQGEALVSGSVTPDTFLVGRDELDILEARPGNKVFRLDCAQFGGLERNPIPLEEHSALSIDYKDARGLASIGRQLEKHFGLPQDIEWAMSNGELFILQSRPLISTRLTELVSWENPVPEAKWLRGYRLGEWLPDPVTPLFATAVLPWLATGRENKGLQHLGWRRGNSIRYGVRMLEPWFVLVNGYFYTRFDPATGPITTRQIAAADSVKRASTHVDLTNWLRRWYRVHLPRYLQHVEEQKRFDLNGAETDEILLYLENLSKDAGALWFILAPIGFAFEDMTFKPFYEEHVRGNDGPEYSVLFSGYDNKVLEGERFLHNLTSRIREDRDLTALFNKNPNEILADLPTMESGHIVLDSIAGYKDTYGHQLHSFDVYFPTIGERPDLIIMLIKSYLTQNPAGHAQELEIRKRERKSATADSIKRMVSANPDLVGPLKKILGWYQLCAKVRENITFAQQMGWPLMRSAALELGKRLVGKNALEFDTDVFFLERDEIVLALNCNILEERDRSELAEKIAFRRSLWESQRNLSAPMQIPNPEDPLWNGKLSMVRPGLVKGIDGAKLIGQSASPGRFVGRARVITSIEEFGKLQLGEVLVAAATNPAWTPLFPLASAVVTEVGGGATHCSLVAREHGIPCVMGTNVATSVIHDGQIITVDGTEGIVYL